MRHILKLHRDLDTNSLPQADHDYTIETFDPAIHKQQWLDLNNLVFSHHPDQGNWAMQDLDNRMAEPWFDEKGFFLATENGNIEGFNQSRPSGRALRRWNPPRSRWQRHRPSSLCRSHQLPCKQGT
jgi:mycothiol synthase